MAGLGRVVGQENNELFDVGLRKKSLTFFTFTREKFSPVSRFAAFSTFSDFYDTFAIPHDADGQAENV